jgi:3-phytase
MNAESIEFGLVKKFGATSGEGTIRVVESIAGDPVHDNLLIAEEDESQTRILVYDIAGNYKKDFGGDLFEHQAEGIALYDCDGDRGYWICTDQTLGDNAFHVFDRKTFEHLGSFLSKTVKNTDGVWLTQEKFDGYPDGCFIAVHNDGGIGAIGWGKIADSLGLRCK